VDSIEIFIPAQNVRGRLTDLAAQLAVGFAGAQPMQERRVVFAFVPEISTWHD